MSSADNIDAKTLTLFDFGGQCAYYACHQIYLTRRAFYVVVVDASKRLDQKVDKEVCDKDGSVFSGWTYGDYFVFWIKSIHTYCGSDNDKYPKPTILIVATHWEKENRQYQDKNALLHSLQQKLPKESNFSQYIVEQNCYCTYFPVQTLHDLQQHFFDIASHRRWKENIPMEWAFFEIEINQKKESEKILDIEKLTTKLTDSNDKIQEKLKSKKNMLRYYHDAGKVLYFNEEGLYQYVIIDVQWFIDAFKHIITDKLHFQGISAAQVDWEEYYTTGILRDRLLTEIWRHEDKLKEKLVESGIGESDSHSEIRDSDSEDSHFDVYYNPRYLLHHKEMLLNYMQILGLMAVGEEFHYVPCMNRKESESGITDLIQRSESRSSILIYRFSCLPFFLFFRLVVSCMQIKVWEVLITNGTSCLYKNAALFSVHEYNVVLSVTQTSIQLQVFHPVPGCSLDKNETYKVQNTIEIILNDIAGTFHRRLMFERGFKCQEDSARVIAVDINEKFLHDRYVYERDGKILCPLHPVNNQHFINATKLSEFWKLH